MKFFPHYLSISSKNNLSDIGKAKLKRTRLSSSRVTKPSPRLSNATNARLMLPWFSSIWGERKELLELWKLSIGVLSIWNAWTCLDELSRTPNCFVGKLLKDQSILLLNITFNSHNLSTRLCFEFCLEEINFCQGLKGSTTKLNQCTFFLSFCSKSVIVSTGGDCLAAWLDRGLLFTAASFTRCWSSTRFWQTKQYY